MGRVASERLYQKGRIQGTMEKKNESKAGGAYRMKRCEERKEGLTAVVPATEEGELKAIARIQRKNSVSPMTAKR